MNAQGFEAGARQRLFKFGEGRLAHDGNEGAFEDGVYNLGRCVRWFNPRGTIPARAGRYGSRPATRCVSS